MAKLQRLRPDLKSLAPRVAYLERQPDADRRDRHPWRAWYGTARWQALRWSVLVAAEFRCAMCSVQEAKTSQLVADHIRAHRGDAGLFWDESNLQCLCKTCHDGEKQRQEAARR